ncbi:MAG: beta-ketoacyl-ACP synthase III [Planctomycetota bacterium]
MTSPDRSASPNRGVTIAGSGSYLPDDVVSNAELERVMDTSDEWIVQRTGIRERRRARRDKGETTTFMATEALRRALEDANLSPSDLDMVVVATVTSEMVCPSTACRVANTLGVGNPMAFDLSAACSGFVYAMNLSHEMVRNGIHRNVGVVGAESLSRTVEFNTRGRGTAIIFGDGAGAAVISATDDATKGVLAQSSHSDGAGWKDLYIPNHEDDHPESWPEDTRQDLGLMHMNGRSVFKFAVSTFPNVIQQTLDKAGVSPEEIDMYVCHQSNVRILEAARERFGVPKDKLYVNIDRVGNTSAASVPICLDELKRSGRVREGQKIMLVAFGAGLTWSASLWQL